MQQNLLLNRRPPTTTQTWSEGAAVITYASTPITLTGETATATAQAEGGGSISLDSGIGLVGATASVTSLAGAGTLTITGGGISLTGVTAVVTGQANTGTISVGTGVAGDSHTSPTVIGWADGSVTWSTASYTTESTEPASSGAYYRSRWFAYYGNRLPVTFTASAASAIRLDVWDASNFNDPDSWSEISLASGTSASVVDIFASATQPTLVRVSNQADTSINITLEWTVSTLPETDAPDGTGALLQIIDPEVEYCPNSITWSLYDVPEEDVVSMRITPDPLSWGTIDTFDADDSGVILGESLPLDGDLPAGTYTLVATYTGGTASDTFQVLEAPVTFPADETADLTPSNTPVTRWQLHDRSGDLADFEFTYNPERMTSPWVIRQYTTASTTSPGTQGQAQVWESTRHAVDWEFTGYIDTEADIDALQEYVNLNRRFYLIDHRQRVWVVTFKGWDLQPKRVFATPYAHTYTIRALIYYLESEGEVD